MTPIDLLRLMLLDFFEEHFELVSTNNSEEKLYLYFEEKAKSPKEFKRFELVPKGFLDEITVQNLPLS
jgi:hypothetical protein